MNRYICIHGHFYQPPRENPWSGKIEEQQSAHPYPDWNQKITRECYQPNSESRIFGAGQNVIGLVNNYAKISFNFGPTLLSWLEENAQNIYQNILEADRLSLSRYSGHGSAIAQGYNHIIMPLANLNDKRTQVIWGLKDFEHRFKRKPEGMWLPETAVDIQTLEILAEHDIKFTILAPHQVKSVRRIGEQNWKSALDSKINTQRAYLCKLPSGREISLFFYDGPIAQESAFGDLLTNGEDFANRLLHAFPHHHKANRLVHIATDGETYGHHHRFGEMALTYCLYTVESDKRTDLTIYGEYLEKNPPEDEVQILENTSWSCPHGVERWRSNCNCQVTAHPSWHRKWRAPLKEGLDYIRDELIVLYEAEMKSFSDEPFRLRDQYIDCVLDRSEENIERFCKENINKDISDDEKNKILSLLEMQHYAMLMYTSCGWFFDDISGIESIQVLQYAARAMQFARELKGIDLEEKFIQYLKEALSNKKKFRDGAKVYEQFVMPAMVVA